MSKNEEPDTDAQAVFPSRGPDRDQMASDYLPKSEDWMAKTALDLNDPQAVAALMQFARMFPEVDDLQPIIDEFSTDFMKARTSVEAQSRTEYKSIIESMFGGHSDDDGVNKFAAALAGDIDDD